jgi:signal transduction histidine kinase
LKGKMAWRSIFAHKENSARRNIYTRIFCAFFATYFLLMIGFSIFLIAREKKAAGMDLRAHAVHINNRAGDVLRDQLDDNMRIKDPAEVKKELLKVSLINLFGTEMAVFTGDWQLLFNTNDYWLCGYTERSEGNRHFVGYGFLNPRDWFKAEEITELENYLYANPRPKKVGDLAGYAVHLQGFWIDNEMIIPDKITVNAMFAHTFDEKGGVKSSGGTRTDDIVYTSGYENTKDLPYFQHGHIKPETGGSRNSKKQAALRQMVTDPQSVKEAIKQLDQPGRAGERVGFLTYRYYLVLPYQNSVKVIGEQNYYSDFWTVVASDISIWERSHATLLFLWISSLLTFMLAAAVLSKQTYQIYQEKDKLEKRRREMTDALAHDLKTPLSIISGYAQNLQENVHTEKREHYAKQIQANVGRMDELIHGMLEMTMLGRDPIQVNLEDISLDEVCDEVISHYQHFFEEKSLTVRLEGNAVLRADRLLIARAIDNFFINALEHTPDGGTVSILIRDDILEVHNSGSHIPGDKINEIWLPFKKVDPARGNTKKGTGLGLAIVRTIFELHGFSYGARNSAAGPVFWFKFR